MTPATLTITEALRQIAPPGYSNHHRFAVFDTHRAEIK